MSLLHTLQRAGGIMRASELLATGFTVHSLRRALADRSVERPQRGWIALPGADPALLHAVRHGLTLSCVSVTSRLGLWLHASDGLHFAARTSHPRPGVEHTVHWGAAVLRREPWCVLDRLENALNYVAYCRPAEEAIAIWESALNRRLVALDELRRYPYRGRAREILESSTPYSDSGVESYVARRLRALRIRFVAQAFTIESRVDFLIEGWLVLQVDGSTHTGIQRDRDNRQDVEHGLRGLQTIRVGYHQVFSAWPEVQLLIMRTLSQGPPQPAVRAVDRSSDADNRRISPPELRSLA